MRLVSAHVANFGRLSNYDVDFDEKFTVINKDNGWGKSTFAAFIRVMLFGFEGEKKSSELEKERVRYKPWQGGTFGGNLVINADGRNIRIERTFGEKASADRFAVYDADTNLPCDDYSEKIGEEILGINSESFKKTVFITQNEVGTKATDSINAKIGSREGELADMGAYEDAINYIDDLYVKLAATRKTGALAKLRDEITAINTRITQAGDLSGSIEKLREKKQQVSADIEELQAKQKELTEQQQKVSLLKEKESKREIYRSYEEEYNTRLEALNAFDTGTPVDLEKVEEAARRWNCIQESRASNEEDLKKIEEHYRLAYNQRTIKNIFGFGFVVGGAAVAALGAVIASFINPVWGMMIGIFGIVVLFTGIVVARRVDYKYKVNKDLARSFEANYKDLEAAIQTATDMVTDTLQEYGVEFDESTIAADLARLTVSAKEYQLRSETYVNLKADLARVADKLEKYKSENDIENLLKNEDGAISANLTSITGSLQNVIEDINQKRNELHLYTRQLEELGARYEDINEAETTLTDLREQADALAKKVDLLGTTGIYLRKAKEALTGKYMSPLKTSFDRYYSMIRADADEDYDIDANATLTLRSEGVLRDIGYLSSGLHDVAGLCMRLAFVDAMYEDEKPMIILDDPFVNLDEHNLAGAKKLIENVSQDYQVILFSCRSGS